MQCTTLPEDGRQKCQCDPTYIPRLEGSCGGYIIIIIMIIIIIIIIIINTFFKELNPSISDLQEAQSAYAFI